MNRKPKVSKVDGRWRVVREGYGLTVADVAYRDSWEAAIEVATDTPSENEANRGTGFGIYQQASRPYHRSFPRMIYGQVGQVQ